MISIPEDTTLFKVSGLVKRFGQKELFRSLDLEVNRGQAVFVLGYNGAGKSTLLHCLAGLEAFDEGSIEVSLTPTLRDRMAPGKSLATMMRRRIGIVFQNAGRSLWPHKTVLKNVADPLLLQSDKSDPVEVARTKLKELGIGEEYLNMYPEQLSGGQQQRVAIARTLACDPAVLLLDEVTDHLDPPGVEILLGILKDYASDEQRTLIVVTHWTDLLTRWDGEVVVIGNGGASAHPSSYSFLDSPPPEIGDLVREVTPRSHELLCGRRSLEAAAFVMEAALDHDRAEEFPQRLVECVSNLLAIIDPDHAHLVLLVLREEGDGETLVVRGACASSGFELNGRHVTTGLNGVVREVLQEHNGKREIRREIDGDVLRASPRGVTFYPGGIIKTMFDPERRSHLYYEFAPGHRIEGVCTMQVEKMTPPEKAQYYEFSRETKRLFLFATEWKEEVVGVLSIDSYSADSWLPFLARNIKMITSMGAMWMGAQRRMVEHDARKLTERTPGLLNP